MKRIQEIDVLHYDKLERCSFSNPDKNKQFAGWALSREAAQRGEVGTLNGVRLVDGAAISAGLGYNHQTIDLYAIWSNISTVYVPVFPPAQEPEPEPEPGEEEPIPAPTPFLSILWSYTDFQISGLSALSSDTTAKIAWTVKKTYRYSDSAVDVSSETISSEGYCETSEPFAANGELGSGISTATRQLVVWLEKEYYGRASCVISQGGYTPTYTLYIAPPSYSYYIGNKPVPDECPELPQMPTEWYLPSALQVATVDSSGRETIQKITSVQSGLSSLSGVRSEYVLKAPGSVWLSWTNCYYQKDPPISWQKHARQDISADSCGMWFDFLSGWKSSSGRFVKQENAESNSANTPEELLSTFSRPYSDKEIKTTVQLTPDSEEIWTPVYVNCVLPKSEHMFSTDKVYQTYDPLKYTGVFNGSSKKWGGVMGGKFFPCAGTLRFEGEFGIDLVNPADGVAIPKSMSGGFKIQVKKAYSSSYHKNWTTVADVRSTWYEKDPETGKPYLRTKVSVSIPVERYDSVRLDTPYSDMPYVRGTADDFSDGEVHNWPDVEAYLSSITFTHHEKEDSAAVSLYTLNFENGIPFPKVLFPRNGSYDSQIALPASYSSQMSSRVDVSRDNINPTYTGSKYKTGADRQQTIVLNALDPSKLKNFVINGSFYEFEISHLPCNDGKDDVYPEISYVDLVYEHPYQTAPASHRVFEPPAGEAGPSSLKFGVYMPLKTSVFGNRTATVVVGWKKAVFFQNTKSCLQNVSTIKQTTWQRARLLDE